MYSMILQVTKTFPYVLLICHGKLFKTEAFVIKCGVQTPVRRQVKIIYYIILMFYLFKHL